MASLADALMGALYSKPQQVPKTAALANALKNTRSVSEEDLYRSINPIDELRRTVNTQTYTPEQAAENRKKTLWEALSVIPGPGNVISAHDAYTGAGDATQAFQHGDYKGGALASALAALSGAGAVFGLPVGKFAKGAADAGKDTLFSGLGKGYELKVTDASASGHKDINVAQDGKTIARIQAHLNKRGDMLINNIAGFDGERWTDFRALSNQIGTKGIMQIRDQLQRMFPQIKSFSGDRVGGSRADSMPHVKIKARKPE